jgi:hypothetical protein
MAVRPTPAFTWLDGLILAVFLGAAIAAAAADDPRFLATMSFSASRRPAWDGLPAWAGALELPSKRAQSDFGAFLAVMTLGVGLVTFRRVPARRLGLPRPGVAATAAAAMALLAHTALFVARSSYQYLWARVGLASLAGELHGPEFQPNAAGAEVTGAILGIWAYLALAHGWRARDDWRDWLGRWLGWAWLSNIAFHALFVVVWG